jgi:hypothetical protein
VARGRDPFGGHLWLQNITSKRKTTKTNTQHFNSYGYGFTSHTTLITFKIFILTHQATHELSIAHTHKAHSMHFKMLINTRTCRTHKSTHTCDEQHFKPHLVVRSSQRSQRGRVLFGRDATRS